MEAPSEGPAGSASDGEQSLHNLLVASARAGLSMQKDDGALPAGRNGPYNDSETPVRNTGHWAMVFLKAYDLTGQKVFRASAEEAVEYLLAEEARPMGATFWHRTNPRKDTCNGLIGQAWSIEALATAGRALEREDALAVAAEVFALHPFKEERGVWTRVAVDGFHLGPDWTFNHQLWFAAAGSILAALGVEHAREEVDRFMDCLERNFRVRPCGLIRHGMVPDTGPIGRVRRWLRKLRRGRAASRRKRDIGYQAFNLYAFAILHGAYPDHRFWGSRDFQAALDFTRSDKFRAGLEGNPYGYPYNPPGLEMPYALQVFIPGSEAEQGRWLARQLDRTWDVERNLMARGTPDPATLAARMYEGTRIADLPAERRIRGTD